MPICIKKQSHIFPEPMWWEIKKLKHTNIKERSTFFGKSWHFLFTVTILKFIQETIDHCTVA